MEVNAIRPHLDGTIEVSDDYGLTWNKFEGIVVNATLAEHEFDMNALRKLRKQPGPEY
jgi:replication initiation and membrane attachment protein DnaB